MSEDATAAPSAQPCSEPLLDADLAESTDPYPEPSRLRWLFYAGGTALAGWGLLGVLTPTGS